MTQADGALMTCPMLGGWPKEFQDLWDNCLVFSGFTLRYHFPTLQHRSAEVVHTNAELHECRLTAADSSALEP
jgi:hypothetical protein